MLISIQMRWAGHVVRMDDDRIPKQLFYGELKSGKRPQHKPRKRFKDSIKNNLKQLQLDVNNWEEIAKDRCKWRSYTREACKALEAKNIAHNKLKRDLRKGVHTNLDVNITRWECETCGRILLSKAGFVNHRKSHKQQLPGDFLPPRPGDTTCSICSRVCKSTAGLKRHMAVHKANIPQESILNPVKTLTCVCHICHRPCKSVAGLKSHLRGHERHIAGDVDTNYDVG